MGQPGLPPEMQHRAAAQRKEANMDVPSKSNKAWVDIVTGKKTFQLKFLAAKILLGRLTRSVKEDPSPENISSSIDQIYAIFANNVNMPSVQDDLKTIFG